MNYSDRIKAIHLYTVPQAEMQRRAAEIGAEADRRIAASERLAEALEMCLRSGLPGPPARKALELALAAYRAAKEANGR